MKIRDLRTAGEMMGREGLAKRALQIAKDMVEEDSYKGAIRGVGRMSVLMKACTFDDYWEEKSKVGKVTEEFRMEDLLNTRD